jgi:hypothetical protein
MEPEDSLPFPQEPVTGHDLRQLNNVHIPQSYLI